MSRFFLLVLCVVLCGKSVSADEVRQPAGAQAKPTIFAMFNEYAEFAAVAYASPQTVKQYCESQKYQLTELSANIADQVRYIIATNHKDKSQIIAIRGTANMENAILDADFVLTPDAFLGIELHNGFAQSSQNIYRELKTKIRKDYKINITGHSLGGAVAVILAMYLDKSGYTLGDIVTFGQPKVTNRAGAKAFQHLNIIRVNTLEDMVPIVPPFDASQIMSLKFDIFWHLGKEYVLLSDDYYATLESLDSLLRGIDFLNKTPTEENIYAHQMETYLQALKSLRDKGKEIPFDQRLQYLTPNIEPQQEDHQPNEEHHPATSI